MVTWDLHRILPISWSYRSNIPLYNVGPPNVTSWFRFAPITIVISTINHSYWSYWHQFSYRLGAPLCIHLKFPFISHQIDDDVSRSICIMMYICILFYFHDIPMKYPSKPPLSRPDVLLEALRRCAVQCSAGHRRFDEIKTKPTWCGGQMNQIHWSKKGPPPFFFESWPLWECTFFHAVITLIIILVIIQVIKWIIIFFFYHYMNHYINH